MQIIFHIDLDAFFASCEIIRDPSLKGKPLVVAGTSRRAIVSTASYEARKFGIHSAMPLYKAKELCKNLVVVPVHYDLYKELSNKFFTYLETFTNKIQIASIDECYMDVTEYIVNNKVSPLTLAKTIQDTVLNKLQLSCSIGVSPNKFLSKMASDIKKPHGITILTKNNFREILWPIEIEKMFGIGKQTAPKLHLAGFNIIGDIASKNNYTNLKAVLGNGALIAYRHANGIDNSKLITESTDNKSISNATTFEYDESNIDVLSRVISDLTRNCVNRASSNNLVCNTVSLTLKYDKKSKSHQKKLGSYTIDFDKILGNVMMLFDEMYLDQKIRLISIELSNLLPRNEVLKQISIFDKTNDEIEKSNINEIINDLNNEFNSNVLTTASSIMKDKK
ncbi:MAG: DNA polymerase IV [Thomasclavelia sp.]|nr:DNA polymerase IV [Thomasclavelia sp.]